jgi:hypothetical protein
VEILNTNAYPHISVLDFSWFPELSQQTNSLRGQRVINKQVKIVFSKRNPFDKLSGIYASQRDDLILE